ncbi:MAG: thiamine ABC transporter substrate-binding protein [Euryarchaeota archaeon]
MTQQNRERNPTKPDLILMVTLLITAPVSGCVMLDEGSPDNLHDGEIVIVTYDVLALSDDMISEFEKASGLNVTILKLDDAGSILDYLLQNRGNTNVDLAIGLDNTYLQTAIEFDLLEEVDLDKSAMYAPGSSQGRNAMDPLGPYDGPLAVPYDMGYICLNYDTEAVDGENLSVPSTLEDLTGPEWRGKVALPSPVSSSPGRGFMLASLDYFDWQSDDGLEFSSWWSDMIANDVVITSGWTEAYETHYTGGYGEWTEGYIGDAHITVSYCHSPGVESYYNGNWTRSATLDIPKTSLFQVEYAAAVSGGNSLYAQEFIEYLVSPEVNSMMPYENLMYSVLSGLDLPEEDGYRSNSQIPSDPASIPMEDIDDHMEAWLDRWNSAVTSGG